MTKQEIIKRIYLTGIEMDDNAIDRFIELAKINSKETMFSFDEIVLVCIDAMSRINHIKYKRE